MNHFLYKLIPPRPAFDTTMTEPEAEIMGAHAGYWTQLLADRVAVVFGPVADPAGVWGLAIVEAGTEHDVRALAEGDPAVTSGLATYAIHAMPSASTRP